MIKHLVTCEMCDNHFHFHPLQRITEWPMPDTWLTVFEGKDIQGQEGWHFCSKRCLYSWLRGDITANDIALEEVTL
jgi:hypothetical protein